MTDAAQDPAASGFHRLETVAGDTLDGHAHAAATAGGLAEPPGERSQAGGDQAVQDVAAKAADVKTAARDLAGAAQQALGQVPDQVRAAADRVAGQARDAYGAASARAQDLAGRVDPVVKARPYRAIAIAAAVGFAVGHLTAAMGPRTVYVARD